MTHYFKDDDKDVVNNGTGSTDQRNMYPNSGINAAAAVAASRHPGPPQPTQPYKFTILENCDRIKEEFNFLQTQYHSIKLDLEKLAQEKTEMQRHYVMYYEMSYGLNVEMHKQTEISKRLNAIIVQIVPFLQGEHQQQVLSAVDRAKQITMTDLNAVIGQRPDLPRLLQQMHVQQMPVGHAPPIPLNMPHPGLPPGALSAPPPHPLAMLGKFELHRPDDAKSTSGLSANDERHRSSISPSDRDKYRPRSPTEQMEMKKIKKDDKDMGHQSDGEKSDQDLVVDDASESAMSPMPNAHNSNGGTHSPRENGLLLKKMDHPDRLGPHSPRSGTSSNASTPSNKKMEEKPSTPLSKSVTPTNSNGTNGDRNMPKPPVLNPNYPHPYLPGVPPELQGAYPPGPVPPQNLPGGYPRPPLQMGFENHPQMRAPPLAPSGLGMLPSGKAASASTTPILKSANTSLNRKRIHERIKNSVQFQLISENGLRKVLEDAAKGENIGAYEDYIRAMRDADLSDPDFGVLIKESRQCIELLKPKFTVFVETIISLNWINRNESLIVEYQKFLIDLLSEHNKYTTFTLSKLIQFWIPKPIDESFWKNGVPDERIKFFLNYVHQTLSKILDVIPMANDFAIDVIEKLFPYYTKSSYIIAGYMFNMMWLIDYRPMFREDVLLLLFKNFVLMDVSVSRNDIEAAERMSQDAEEIFKMDSDDVKTLQQEGMHHPIAETMDICLDKLLHYIEAQWQPKPNEDSNKSTIRLEQLFKILLHAFENYVLPTHKINHVQFVMFYVCSLKTSIVKSFIRYLCSKVWDPNVATTIRQSAVGYIASLLARGKFISQNRIKQTLHDLCRWAHNYVEKSDSSQNTTSIKAHLVFYAVCEAIFYVIAFRSRDLTNSSENLTFLQSLQLSTLVTCHLNPLRVCLPAVATAFAGVTRAHQLAYCHTILERNARRKLAMVFQNEIVLPEETTFPFDPYLLKESGVYIAEIYQHYKPNEDEDPNGDNIHIASNDQRRRKRNESLLSSVDDDDFLTDPKRNKLAEIAKSFEKEILFSYGTSPGFH